MGLVNINRDLLKFLEKKGRKAALNYLAPFMTYQNIQVVSYERNRAGEPLFGDTDNHLSYPMWLDRRAEGHYDDMPFRAQGRNLATGLALLGADEHTHNHGMRILAMAPHLRKAAIKELRMKRFPKDEPA